MDSALLKHLGEAGLLGDVSALLARARSRDESNLRRVQSQAKGIRKVFECNRPFSRYKLFFVSI